VPFRFITNGEKHVVTVEEIQQTAQNIETPISKFLKENTPALSKYSYREWSDDTYKQVALYLKSILPYTAFMRELIENTREEKMKQMLIDVTSGNFGAIPSQAAAPAVSTPAPAAQQTIAPSAMTEQKSVNLMDMGSTSPQNVPPPQTVPPAQTAPAATAQPDENSEFDNMLKGL
jgi:hypothetical protein